MGGTVVGDDVKLLARIGIQQPAKETYECHAVVAADRFGPHPTAMHLQGSQQRSRPVALIFVTKPFDLMGLQRQAGLGSVQGLNGGLLIDRDHHPILRRVHV